MLVAFQKLHEPTLESQFVPQKVGACRTEPVFGVRGAECPVFVAYLARWVDAFSMPINRVVVKGESELKNQQAG